jgi:signal-transduction protein with cAMP-binding, CBS, and nucleotidyltransferase domain
MAELPKDKPSVTRFFYCVEIIQEARISQADWPEREEMAMKVREIMHKDVVSVLPTATIHDAALKMKEENVGSILILDDNRSLKGIVTDRDLSLAVAADFKDPKKTYASDVMTKEPITIDANADIDFAVRMMKEGKVHRLPVCENSRVVGLLSTADVAAEIKGELDNFFGLEEALAKTH